MGETAKTETRNYLMAGGFFVWALTFAMLCISALQGEFLPPGVDLVTGSTLVGIGAALAIFRKRDITSIIFIICGFNSLFYVFCMINETDAGRGTVLIGIAMLLVSLVILTSNDRQKHLLFILPFLDGLHSILSGMFSVTVSAAVYLIIALFAFYYSFVCAFEKIDLPGKKLLTADETTDFKASGSVIGYLMFAMICISWTFMYLLGTEHLTSATVFAINTLFSFGLILAAVLLLAIGKMRFTPIMFLAAGILSLLAVLVSGPMYFIIGLGFIVIGLFAIMRSESRILPGIMLIVYGLTSFISIGISGFIAAQTTSMILNLISLLISLYLAFAVFSARKLPLI